MEDKLITEVTKVISDCLKEKEAECQIWKEAYEYLINFPPIKKILEENKELRKVNSQNITLEINENKVLSELNDDEEYEAGEVEEE